MIQERINYTQLIWEITRLLQDADAPEEALRTGLAEVVRSVGAEAGVVWVWNRAGDERIYPSFWIGGEDLTGFSYPSGEGAMGTAMVDCVTVATDDVVCVPLLKNETVIGAIQLTGKKDGSTFDEADVGLLETLSQLAGIAITKKEVSLGFTEEKKAILSLRGVTKTFGTGDNAVQVLKGVNLDIREGEFLVILGESGCGKSTMLNIIGGMDRLTTGTFVYDGKDYSTVDDDTLTMYRRHAVGFIFQAYNLMPTMTAKENLEFIGELCDDPLDAEEALASVKLLERKDNYPAQMSGGQQQRVSIARALMKKPKVILADEPTAALDYETSIEVLEVLEKVIKAGTTLLMVTHNEEIAKMANRIIRMKSGVVAEVIVNRHPAAAKELVW